MEQLVNNSLLFKLGYVDSNLGIAIIKTHSKVSVTNAPFYYFINCFWGRTRR
ncbi:hypothetical protein HanRHA438_Chr04g0185041 [Helianthus annuus]|nr:hypothetical protein HanRHA438_Chr04g0185041 [Helianthus annuus]